MQHYHSNFIFHMPLLWYWSTSLSSQLFTEQHSAPITT